MRLSIALSSMVSAECIERGRADCVIAGPAGIRECFLWLEKARQQAPEKAPGEP